MLFTTLVSAAVVLTTASARNAAELNTEAPSTNGRVHIVNRCDYDVNLWSVYKDIGCSTQQLFALKSGQTYSENFQMPENRVGISIKISKTQQCSGNDITQFEYYYETHNPGYNNNFFDISYVDCGGGDCPTMKEGYYLHSQDHNPVLSCTDAASCAKISYIDPNDVRTKSCSLNQDIYFYMCGGHAPGDKDSKPARPSKPDSPPQQQPQQPPPQPKVSPPVQAPSPDKPSPPVYPVQPAPTPDVKKADLPPVPNPAPSPPPAPPAPPAPPRIKTDVVYVTEYKWVDAKRHEHAHAHAHARRHQKFRA